MRLSLLALATAAASSDIGHMKNLPRRTADPPDHRRLCTFVPVICVYAFVVFSSFLPLALF